VELKDMMAASCMAIPANTLTTRIAVRTLQSWNLSLSFTLSISDPLIGKMSRKGQRKRGKEEIEE
jgi:hypothetical protein